MSFPFVKYIRQRPDGSWQGAPGKHGPWRPIPAPEKPSSLFKPLCNCDDQPKAINPQKE